LFDEENMKNTSLLIIEKSGYKKRMEAFKKILKVPIPSYAAYSE